MRLRRLVEHWTARRYLDAYVDGELTDPVLTDRVGRHIAECPMCNDQATLTAVVKQRLSLRRRWPSDPLRALRRDAGDEPGNDAE